MKEFLKEKSIVVLVVCMLIWIVWLAINGESRRGEQKIKECNDKWWVIFFITDSNQKRISEDICSIY